MRKTQKSQNQILGVVNPRLTKSGKRTMSEEISRLELKNAHKLIDPDTGSTFSPAMKKVAAQKKRCC